MIHVQVDHRYYFFDTNLDLLSSLANRDLCPRLDKRSLNINENKSNNGQ